MLIHCQVPEMMLLFFCSLRSYVYMYLGGGKPLYQSEGLAILTSIPGDSGKIIDSGLCRMLRVSWKVDTAIS